MTLHQCLCSRSFHERSQHALKIYQFWPLGGSNFLLFSTWLPLVFVSYRQQKSTLPSFPQITTSQPVKFGEDCCKPLSLEEIRLFLRLSYRVHQRAQHNSSLKWKIAARYFVAFPIPINCKLWREQCFFFFTDLRGKKAMSREMGK